MAILARDIGKSLEAWAPRHLAEDYDNVGLIVGNPSREVSGLLINLDVTEEVLEEALEKGCNMVLTHHPIWFRPLKRLNGQDYVSRIIMKAVKHDLMLYAFHTNLDNVSSGVNQKMAEKLGLQNLSILKPKEKKEPQIGSGMLGYLPTPMSKEDFLDHVSKAFGSKGIRYADFSKESIQKVAICGGAGSILTAEAIKEEADAFVTADITYHKFFDNEGKILLMDIGHYESEQFTSELIAGYLKEKFPNFALQLSEIQTNPVKYWS